MDDDDDDDDDDGRDDGGGAGNLSEVAEAGIAETRHGRCYYYSSQCRDGRLPIELLLLLLLCVCVCVFCLLCQPLSFVDRLTAAMQLPPTKSASPRPPCSARPSARRRISR